VKKMEREDVNKILADIAVLFPNFTKMNQASKTETVNAWHWALKDFSYKSINDALELFIKTSGSDFAPSPSKLISLTYKPTELTELNPIEAWGIVSKAVCRSTYYAEEEFEKMPPAIQQAVGSPNQLRAWAQSDCDALETVIASNFQKTYRTVLERQRTIAMLPQDMKMQLILNQTVAAIEAKED